MPRYRYDPKKAARIRGDLVPLHPPVSGDGATTTRDSRLFMHMTLVHGEEIPGFDPETNRVREKRHAELHPELVPV